MCAEIGTSFSRISGALREGAHRAFVALLAACTLFGSAGALAQQAPARVFAVSDVHGAYDSFVQLLQTAKLVDARTEWIGGASALVVVGDVLDRGAGSRRVVELLMRLEAAARAAGGRVQLVLGNHEVMNLTGDLRYVSAADYEAYSAQESAAERDAAWQRFRAARMGRGAGENALAAEFARSYPPGFFAQRAAFASDGAFGAWLLRQPVIFRLGDTVFVHGGLPGTLNGKTVDAVNAEYGVVLRDYVSAFEVLRDAGALHAEDAFDARTTLVERWLDAAKAEGRNVPDAAREAAQRLGALMRAPELGSGAVYWYRGTVSCSPAVEQDRVARVLASLGAKRVVVGHTPTSTARALSRFDGAVLRVDTGMQQPGGRATAIVLENGDARVLYAGDSAAVAIAPQPRAVGALPAGYDDARLHDVLARAEIAARVKGEGGVQRLRLASAGAEVEALFEPLAARRGERFAPAVAAYRLDRLLGLDLVPVAVLRSVGNELGTVYVDQSGLADETQRAEAEESAEAWCPLADQFALMYLFDALAYSEGRLAADTRYAPGSWQLALTGNRRLFGTATRVPAYLRSTVRAPSPRLAERLRALDAASLQAALGDVLDAARVQSLLARRDRLLALPRGD